VIEKSTPPSFGHLTHYTALERSRGRYLDILEQFHPPHLSLHLGIQPRVVVGGLVGGAELEGFGANQWLTMEMMEMVELGGG